MKKINVDTLLREIDNLLNIFRNCKAYFPSMTDENIGQQSVSTAPYYWNKGFNISFNFSSPLTKDNIKKNNEISHWLNQNVIIRLYALLESNHVISNNIQIDQAIDGWKELDLVRRLRGGFVHGSGKYKRNKPEHDKLFNELNQYFSLNLDANAYDDFPISIHTVIDPLFEGCKRYIRDKYSVNED